MDSKPKKTLQHFDILILFFLASAVIFLYWQVRNHEFINFDDPIYITENLRIQSGLSFSNFLWAFTTNYAGNWHPVTWLSHMTDYYFFGMNPGGHHLVNIFLHMANSVLLFLFFRLATNMRWQSFVVAALFALHPLHVESVAWASERKDVLSMFFLLLTLITYGKHISKPSRVTIVSCYIFFIMGAMSKPMLVTTPLLLLLVDIWPLNRFEPTFSFNEHLKCVIREKIPFMIIAIISIFLTFSAQQSSGAVKTFDLVPMSNRITNAIISYTAYLGKLIYPLNLTVMYPYPETIHLGKLFGASIILLLITIVVFKIRRRYQFLMIGWLWYLITLIPVIGLIQVGLQAMADRYTYIPMIGVYLMIAWGVPVLISGWKFNRQILIATTCILLIGCLTISWSQIGYWKNSIILFTHAVSKNQNDYISHNYLASALAGQFRIDEAIEHYNNALSIKPDYIEAQINLGVILAEQGELKNGLVHFHKALQIDQDNVIALNNIGNIYYQKGKYEDAFTYYEKALKSDPRYDKAIFNMAKTLEALNRLENAIDQYYNALNIRPDSVSINNSLGVALAKKGDLKKAILHFQKAIQLKPDYKSAQENLARAQQLLKE